MNKQCDPAMFENVERGGRYGLYHVVLLPTLRADTHFVISALFLQNVSVISVLLVQMFRPAVYAMQHLLALHQ